MTRDKLDKKQSRQHVLLSDVIVYLQLNKKSIPSMLYSTITGEYMHDPVVSANE